MTFQLELPDIGEGVVDAEVQRWFVAPGDEIQEDQPLVEVMTDKATVVIPAARRGRIVKLFWNVGDVAKVHAPLVEMEAPAAEPRPSAAPAPAPTRPTPAPPPAAPAAAGRKALATPAVRAMARELGVAIDSVSGSGPGGRVTKDDLVATRGAVNGSGNGAAPAGPATTATATPTAAATPTATTSASPATSASPPATAARPPATAPPAPAGAAAEERIPLRGVRKRIAENMARSKRTAAHFTFVEQCDVTELVRLRDRMAGAALAEGVKLTFLPFVLKAAVAALRKYPRLNATMDEERSELVLHRRCDLGIASATDAGLVVPVVRDADRRSLLELAREIERLSEATKAGQVRPEDLGRSTFTVTSLGALGGLFATPVLNHPEVAILGIHRIRPTPVVRDGAIVVREVMNVSVTSDHRVVDGHEAAAFAYEVIRNLEDPTLLFMRMI